MSFAIFQKTATEKTGQNVRTEMNNGTLSSVKAMPQKDLSSDGTSSFAMARRQYTEVYPVINPSVNKQKKFIGGNRDASSVVARSHSSAARGPSL